MSAIVTSAAYVKSSWQFEVRQVELPEPAAGQLLVEVAACGICGTDQHIADRTATDWQAFGHEAAGVVRAVGAGVAGFAVGDRVALDSSAPCGECQNCLPSPYGRGRPDLCPTPTSYWGAVSMGFSRYLNAPARSAVHVPAHLSLDVAALVEPLGVCIDVVQVAGVGAGDHVLVIGPGPLGLGAVFAAAQAGAEKIYLAGRSSSKRRLEAGLALGADTLIHVDQTPLTTVDFGARKPDKIIVTAPPETLPEAVAVAALGGVISYIGIAFDEARTTIALDADDFHFRKLQLRASHAWPGTHARESLRWLATHPVLGEQLISHRFPLADIAKAMTFARDARDVVVKPMIVSG
jgi:L-iditol 2-dehydrogenase